jgi:hypothetical protein
MIGRGEKGAHTIYLIDFGLVKRIYQKNGEIFPVCLQFVLRPTKINLGAKECGFSWDTSIC